MNSADRTRDEWLALRCLAGDDGAFEELVALMDRPLRYYASRVAGGDERACDVVQQVWIRALRDLRKRRLRDPGALRPWLYRIAHGIAVDEVRRSVSRQRAEESHADEFAASTESSAAEISFAADDAAALHRALDQLEPRLREVLTLHFLEDFSVAEIAESTGCPEGTVKSRLHFAKRAMRDLLKKESSS